MREGMRDRMELLFGSRLKINEFSGGHSLVNALITA
jgi:hypothetical protein